MEHWNNSIWSTYKKTDGTYNTDLVLSDSKEHFKEYEFASVRIAAKDKIFHYRNMSCLVVEL